MPAKKQETTEDFPPLAELLIDPHPEGVKWGQDTYPDGSVRWPESGPGLLMRWIEEGPAFRPGDPKEPHVLLINLSHRTFGRVPLPTDQVVLDPRSQRVRLWRDHEFDAFAMVGPVPISLAVKMMRPDKLDNVAAGTHQTRQLFVPPPKGRCYRKLRFYDAKYQREFETCPFVGCADHPAVQVPGVKGQKAGPELHWSIFQAQHFGASLLNEIAIERFMQQVDLRPSVAAYLTFVVRARQEARRERQGLAGAGNLRRRATH